MKRAVAVALRALVCVGIVLPLLAASPIFPTPIHLTREVSDPISEKTIVLQEYAYGNRLISVRDNKTAIADYEKGELIEIDRSAGTYSVTRFETVAKAAKLQGGEGMDRPQAQSERRELKALGAKPTKSGRAADFFEAGGVEVAVDRGVRLSREALEVLLGSAYPGTRNEQHDIVIAAAAGNGGGRQIASNSATAAETYALPLEQNFDLAVGDEHVEFRSTVLRVGNEPPPADAVAIPPGARLVESRTAAVVRELELIDSPPLRPPQKP